MGPIAGVDDCGVFVGFPFAKRLELEADDRLLLDFLIAPPSDGAFGTTTWVGIEDTWASVPGRVEFQNGLANGVLEYEPDAWNTVHAEFRLESADSTLIVNDVPADGVPLVKSDVRSMAALTVRSWTVACGDPYPEPFYVDSARVARLDRDGFEHAILEEDFEEPSGALAGKGDFSEGPAPAGLACH